MTTQEFKKSKHFNTFKNLSGYYQLRWKDDIIIDEPANENYYDIKKAIDTFNTWTYEHEDEWSSYKLKFFDKNFNELYTKTIIADNDKDAEIITNELLAKDMKTNHIIVYDWKNNYVNTID